MRSWMPIAALAAVSLALHAACASAAAVQVEYVKPESFTDIGPKHAPHDDADVLEPLRAHLVHQASRRVPQGQTLQIWITDVDLAGDFEPRQRFTHEVRIVKNIYPPRIDLRFRLTDAAGAVLKEGERKLRDDGFLLHGGVDSGDALRFEKSMLDRWLQAEFGR